MTDGFRPRQPASARVAQEIDCIDCGGRSFLVTRLDDEDPPRPGDILAYRCRDCLDMWYLEIPEEDGTEGSFD